jgi:cytochrome d ubiquinol oxidase subunit II
MSLADVPLLFALAGLTLYTVLGGADFGAGMWQLTAGGGEAGARIRDLAHDSMAPVWEANHVWLIFVLTVVWTAYPTAFGSIASTLSVPLFAAGVGIILRGAAYALRAGARTHAEARRIDTLFALSSLLAPFALGTCIGAIASRRVPVGNASGHLISSWAAATPIAIGVIAVLSCAYLAAVYLAADARRLGDAEMAEAFRRRALGAGALAGAAAVGGLIVIHGDSERLYHGLTSGRGLPALIVSFVAGCAALGLVAARRHDPARVVAAVASAAVVAGWALAQAPTFLPGLTITQAAAPHDTLVAVTVAVIAGGVILFPSLGLLFRLLLTGRFDPGVAASGPPHAVGASGGAAAAVPRGAAGMARAALACFVAGAALVVFVDAWWGRAVGVVCLVACVVLGFMSVAPATLA